MSSDLTLANRLRRRVETEFRVSHDIITKIESKIISVLAHSGSHMSLDGGKYFISTKLVRIYNTPYSSNK